MEHSLLDVVWKMSWQVAILAALVWIVCRLASKAPAAWRHALWIVVLVKFFMPPVVHFPSQLAFWQTAGRAKPQPAIIRTLPTPHGSASPAGVELPHSSTSLQPGDPALSSVAAGAVSDFASVLGVIWVVGAAAMAVLLLVRFLRQARLVRASSAASGSMIRLLAECAGRLRLRRVPAVRVSDNARTPMVAGVFRPMIVLPTGILDSCSDTHLRAILLHELAHVKRHDMLILWLHQLAQIVFFFHPGVWLAGHELKKERELACDEMVLSTSAIRATDYAAGYVSVLKLANSAPVTSTSLAMAEPFELEKRRITMILGNRIPRLSIAWLAPLLIVAVVGLPTFAGISTQPVPKPALVPTIETIAKALRDQEAARGDSLEVTYTVTYSDEGTDSTTAYHYIWTPEGVLFESHYQKAGDGAPYRSRVSLTQGGARILTIGSDGSVKGRISPWTPGSGSINLAQMETTGAGLVGKTLYEEIEGGKVAKVQEKIDGHNCWKVERPRKGIRSSRTLRVWLDPDIGYCPRRLEVEYDGGSKMGPISFKNYRKLEGGVWFPMEMERVNVVGAGRQVVTKVQSIRVGREIPIEELEVKFPSGTHVEDKVSGTNYVVP